MTPFINPHLATCGAAISKEKPVQLSNYPYPIYTVYANQAENDVYMLTKAMIEGYDAYKDGAPGATGMAVKRQTKNGAVPVHKGAARAVEEALGNATDFWAAYRNGNPPSEPDKFAEGWMKARADALARAKLDGGS